jgi:hypothetical protein
VVLLIPVRLAHADRSGWRGDRATAAAGLLRASAKLSPPMITAAIAANPNSLGRPTPASTSGPVPNAAMP